MTLRRIGFGQYELSFVRLSNGSFTDMQFSAQCSRALHFMHRHAYELNERDFMPIYEAMTSMPDYELHRNLDDIKRTLEKRSEVYCRLNHQQITEEIRA